MNINHIAIWVKDIEQSRAWYIKYFNFISNNRYTNSAKGFSSYFLTPKTGGCRLELMQCNRAQINNTEHRGEMEGIAHIAISVGTEELVRHLTELIRHDGYTIVGEPRWTGDGYYESIVCDNEGNWIEITI